MDAEMDAEMDAVMNAVMNVKGGRVCPKPRDPSPW
jgi:hypothetical protein